MKTTYDKKPFSNSLLLISCTLFFANANATSMSLDQSPNSLNPANIHCLNALLEEPMPRAASATEGNRAQKSSPDETVAKLEKHITSLDLKIDSSTLVNLNIYQRQAIQVFVHSLNLFEGRYAHTQFLDGRPWLYANQPEHKSALLTYFLNLLPNIENEHQIEALKLNVIHSKTAQKIKIILLPPPGRDYTFAQTKHVFDIISKIQTKTELTRLNTLRLLDIDHEYAQWQTLANYVFTGKGLNTASLLGFTNYNDELDDELFYVDDEFILNSPKINLAQQILAIDSQTNRVKESFLKFKKLKGGLRYTLRSMLTHSNGHEELLLSEQFKTFMIEFKRLNVLVLQIEFFSLRIEDLLFLDSIISSAFHDLKGMPSHTSTEQAKFINYFRAYIKMLIIKKISANPLSAASSANKIRDFLKIKKESKLNTIILHHLNSLNQKR